MLLFNDQLSAAARQRLVRKILRLTAAVALGSAALHLAAPLLAGQARASDLDLSTSGTQSDGSRFVRIGLNKSVVIRLPEDAKDVIVGNPAIVDAVVRTKNTAYLFARAVGQTNIFFFNASGQQIMNIDLEVALDMKALQKLIERTIPGSQITVDTVNESVVLGGSAATATEAKLAEDLANKFMNSTGSTSGVVNTISVTGGDQVMLKVRVVELHRSVLKNLGVNLDTAFSVGKFAFNLATANPVNNPLISAGASYLSGSTSAEATIEAMERDGVLRTLAEPTLTAISGQPASFHAGGEIPYEQCDSAITSGSYVNCTVTFRPVGVSLSFTPTVLSEGRIALKVKTEVSEQGAEKINSYYTIDSRQAETAVELPSGGSMMMAGLIKNVTREQIDGTPGLKNIPVLGALFRSREFQQNQTEMVVLVTPYVVNPVNPKGLVAPDENLTMATDRDAILFGRLNRIYGTPGKHPEGVYHGNVGYIVE